MDPEQAVVPLEVDDDMAGLNPEGGVVMSFRLQIPNPVVGSIIGKSGEIIKSIRDQSGARVIIADSQPGEDRDVTIKGNLTAVDQAVNLILTHICQVPPSPSFEMEQPDDSLSLKVLVANDQAGAIIGKGGEVIKQLREESGARISIGKKIDFVRTVSIVGNVNTVRAALAVLVRLVHAHPSSARDPFLTGYRAQPGGFRQVGGGGAGAAAAMSPAAAAAGYGFAPPGNPYGNGMPPQAGIMDPQTPVFPETNTLTLSVPHRSVGAIIGKRGQIINEIRAISGCRVDIAAMTPDSQFRTITLTGTPQSIEIAHILIQKYTIRAPTMGFDQPGVPQ